MAIAYPAVLSTPDLAPWVWLELGAHQSRVVYCRPGAVAQERMLPIGTLQLGAGPFRAVPPTPLELENAIASVEDVVMPLAKILPSGAGFFVSGAQVQAVLPARSLELALVEEHFNTLVAFSQGRPYDSSDLRTQPGGAALLLILRECMHHLGFSGVQVL